MRNFQNGMLHGIPGTNIWFQIHKLIGKVHNRNSLTGYPLVFSPHGNASIRYHEALEGSSHLAHG